MGRALKDAGGLSISTGAMRKLALSLSLIAVALALVASPALGAYKTSPEEGRKYAKLHKKAFLKGRSHLYQLRGCWRIGSGGAGDDGVLRGGVVCRFSGETRKSGFGEDACILHDFAAKQGKKRNAFVTETVSSARQPYWIGGAWCGFEPGAEGPSPPIGSIGPPLFG